MTIRGNNSRRPSTNWRKLAAIPLLLAMHGVHGATIFKCVDARGAIAFQGAPCDRHAAQTEVDVREQPLIDPGAPARAIDASHDSAHGHSIIGKHHAGNARADARRSHKDDQPVSWECRAADGEVFYRHSRCPHSVPGDGIARFGVDPAGTQSRRGRHGSRGGAWEAVLVKASRIPRGEACRRINAVTAGGRDGHSRDENVPVYEHLVGRDPCAGY